MIGWLRRLFRRQLKCDFCRRPIEEPAGVLTVRSSDGPFHMQACKVCWGIMELHSD